MGSRPQVRAMSFPIRGAFRRRGFGSNEWPRSSGALVRNCCASRIASAGIAASGFSRACVVHGESRASAVQLRSARAGAVARSSL